MIIARFKLTWQKMIVFDFPPQTLKHKYFCNFLKKKLTMHFNFATFINFIFFISNFSYILTEKKKIGNDIATYPNNLKNSNKGKFEEEIRPKLICFYVFTNNFKADIMKDLCTHIHVGFFKINKNNFSLEINAQEAELLSQVISLKDGSKSPKILMTVGGAGVKVFSLLTKNHTNRKMFIKGTMKVLKQFKLDGIDIDWEWPAVNGDSREKIKFVQLLQEMKKELSRHKKKYILSADVPALQSFIELGFFVQYIAEYVDYVNVMCYDYHFYSKLSPLTGYNAPLYLQPNQLFSNNNVNFSINLWISQSMPRGKIILGLPTFGHSFELKFFEKHDLNAPACGYGSIGSLGFVSYPEVCNFIKTATVIYDDYSEVPYAYAFPNWISYDDEISLSTKVGFALKEKLGGVMVFSVNCDDFDGVCSHNARKIPLIKLIRSLLFNEVY